MMSAKAVKVTGGEKNGLNRKAAAPSGRLRLRNVMDGCEEKWGDLRSEPA